MLERLSPTTRTALRVAAGIGLAIAAGFVTLVLLFVGAVTVTGCFFECSGDPNVVGGGLLLTGSVVAAALAVTSVVWAAIGWKREVLVRVAAVVTGLSTILVLLVVSGF